MFEAASSIACIDRTTRLIPGGAARLAQLTDEELLANTRRLVGKSNQLLATLLLHLAEVEVRGVHRIKRCASLYTYCIYELRFSEDAAARRSAAARWVKQFPALLDAIADGELHLTGLLMIAPHLRPENYVEVLGRARFRTKKELAKLVRELNPLPSVPDLVQPLGPELMMKRLRTPTWAEFVESSCPPVRELPEGDRPRDWANDGVEDVGVAASTVTEAELPVGPVPADLPPITSPQLYQLQFSTVEEHVQLLERARALMARERRRVSLGELHLEAMKLLVASLEKRKFATRTAMEPRQRADAESSSESRQRGDGSDLSSEPRQRGDESDLSIEPRQRRDAESSLEPRQRGDGSDLSLEPRQRGDGFDLNSEPRRRGNGCDVSSEPRQRGVAESSSEPRHRGAALGASFRPSHRGADSLGSCASENSGPCGAAESAEPAGAPRSSTTVGALHGRGRHIPAAIRREVYERDAGRCAYVDARGERCCETRYLELHHLMPFGKGGAHRVSNLALRCAAHNGLAAEEDFGRERMRARSDAVRHEPLSRQMLEK